jgi:hypothetical protein
MKCDNCELPAIYVVERPTANTVYFCARDLPRELHLAAANGDYDFPEEKATKKSKKSVAAPVEESQPETPAEDQPEAPVEDN